MYNKEETNSSEKKVPEGFVPLRNTLVSAGVSVGYDAVSDSPIVGGQKLNKNDSRLLRVGDDYWIDETYAKSFIPKAYENPYKEQMQTILSELADTEFSYDPASDSSLQAAQEQAMLAAKQSANSRGLLGGTTAETMRLRAAQELVPQYEQMAYERYLKDRQGKIEMLSVLDTLADSAFSEYTEKTSLAQKEREFAKDVQTEADKQASLLRTEAFDREKLDREEALRREELALDREEMEQTATAKEFANQLDKVVAMGVVDEEAAKILGIAAGTLTREEKDFLEKIRREEESEAQKIAAEQARDDREWERKKELLKLETDEKIRAALATRK